MHLLGRNGVRCEFFHDVGSRKTFYGGNDLDSAAGGDDVFMADDGLDDVVAAFDQDIGFQGSDKVERRVLFEENNRIDSSESGHNAGTFALGDDRASGAFEPADRSVGVESKDELRTEATAVFEQGDVADVQ